MKKKIGKLVLNRETIRELTGEELKEVAGGVEKCHNTKDDHTNYCYCRATGTCEH